MTRSCSQLEMPPTRYSNLPSRPLDDDDELFYFSSHRYNAPARHNLKGEAVQGVNTFWRLLKIVFIVLLIVGVIALLMFLVRRQHRYARKRFNNACRQIESWLCKQPCEKKKKKCPKPIEIESVTNEFFVSDPLAPRVWETACAACQACSCDDDCCSVLIKVGEDARADRTVPLNVADLSGFTIKYNCEKQEWTVVEEAEVVV
jgi:hypothetical protein